MLVGHAQNPETEEEPDQEVQDGSSNEKRDVHVDGLMADGEIGRTDIGVGPGIERVHREEDRDSEERDEGQRLQSGLYEAANGYAPIPADHIVEEEDAQATESQAAPEDISEQIGLPEMRGVQE